MTSSLDTVLARLPNHIGLVTFYNLRHAYEKAVEKLGQNPLLPLMSPEAAALAYLTDNAGWWCMCKTENLFPFGRIGGGDLLVMRPECDLLGICLHEAMIDSHSVSKNAYELSGKIIDAVSKSLSGPPIRHRSRFDKSDWYRETSLPLSKLIDWLLLGEYEDEDDLEWIYEC